MSRPEDPGALGTALAVAELGVKMGSQQYLRSPYYFFFVFSEDSKNIELILT